MSAGYARTWLRSACACDGRHKASTASPSEGRLAEAEHFYGVVLEQSNDPDFDQSRSVVRSQRLQEASTRYHRYLKRWPRQRNLILNACNCWRGESNSRGWLRTALKRAASDTDLEESLQSR